MLPRIPDLCAFADKCFKATINGFFAIKRDTAKPVDVPAYELASQFSSIADAAFKENPALERQWKEEVAHFFDRDSSKRNDMRVATEIIEYILLGKLSLHLTSYFNTRTLEQSQLKIMERNDIPDVLLSNRILELISRELRDRPWYEPEDYSDSSGKIIAVYAQGKRYSHFNLTMPKSSTVRRVGPGHLIISSKMITLALTAIVEIGYESMEGLFSKYYLDQEDRATWRINVTYQIDARLKRRLGLKVVAWRYYSWIESFIESTTNELDADRFFKRISWDSAEAILRMLFARYPPRESQASSLDDATETNKPQSNDDGTHKS